MLSSTTLRLLPLLRHLWHHVRLHTGSRFQDSDHPSANRSLEAVSEATSLLTDKFGLSKVFGKAPWGFELFSSSLGREKISITTSPIHGSKARRPWKAISDDKEKDNDSHHVDNNLPWG